MSSSPTYPTSDSPIDRASDSGSKQPLSRVLVALVALAVSVFIAITTELMPVGLLPDIAKSFDRGVTSAGIIVTVYASMVAIFSVPLTLATARFARKTVLLATLVTFMCSSVVVALAPAFWLVAVGRALGGAAHALFFAVALGYPSRLLRPQDLGKGMAIVTAGVSIGFVAGVPAATALGVQFGWRIAFGCVSVIALVLLLVVWRLLPPAPVESTASAANRRTHGAETSAAETTTTQTAAADDTAQIVHSSLSVKWRRYVPFIAVQVVNFLVYGAHYVAYTYINPLLRAAGFSAKAVAPMLLVLGGVGLFGLFLSGIFLDRRPRAALLVTIGGFVLGLVGLGCGLDVWAVALASVVVWNIAFGAAPTFFSTASMRTHTVSPDMSGAWINASSNVGIALGAYVGGAVLDVRGLAAVPLVAAGIFVVAFVVVWRSRSGFPARVSQEPARTISLDVG